MSTLRERAVSLATELLLRLGSDTQELELRREGIRVKVSRVAAAPAAPEPVGAAAAPGAVVAPPHPAPPSGHVVNAPLTGVFYRSASPQSPPFVQVGSMVASGDVVGLIEAMKLFNEIRSTASGRVRRVAAENGQLVRAHQPLLELDA